MIIVGNAIKKFAEQKEGPNGQNYLALSSRVASQVAVENNQTIKAIEIQALKSQVIPERYQRNIGTIGIEGQIKLLESQVALIGLGGLGGTILEALVRFGIGKMVVIDGDAFVDSNLNRQVLSHVENLGGQKVEAAKKRAGIINPSTEIETYSVFAHEGNLSEMIQGSQAVVDGLDNISVRFSLEKISKKMGIPFVHGAVAGFMGQVMTIFPEDKGLELIYGARSNSGPGVEKEFGTPCVTPTVVASLQVSEVIKILLGWENLLRNRLLIVDLKELISEIIDFSSGPQE